RGLKEVGQKWPKNPIKSTATKANGGPGGCSESDKNQFLRDQWDFRVFKSFPMFFDVVVPLRSASVHQADALNASLGREVCARRKEDRVGVQPS
ncbi:hypothetical protein NKI41_31905, partial [Mesorhizobium sp. M0601]|uniref:hypothetical protein n=1 Tax=Mesorhizobium sp. M0601 TaxID=2956969 RepID=UPI00333C9977